MEKEQRGKNDMKELQRRKDEFKANWQEYHGKTLNLRKGKFREKKCSDRRIWSYRKLRGEETNLMPKTNVLQEVHTTSASGDRQKKKGTGRRRRNARRNWRGERTNIMPKNQHITTRSYTGNKCVWRQRGKK